MDQQIVQQTAEIINETGGISALGLNTKLFLAQLVHFLIVALIFWKWVYGPLVKMIEKRSENIEKGLKQAKEAQEQLNKIEAERDDLLKEAKKEAALYLQSTHAEMQIR
jgi:F-type H+-transporting ATPase subunit b